MSNSISLVGRLGRDSERKAVGDGHVLEFSVACDTGFGEKKTTTWFKVAYWQKSDKLVEYLVKGAQVFVVGEVSLREYQGKEGDKKNSLELRANSIQLIGSRDQNAAPAQEPAAQKQIPPPAAEEQDPMPF